MAPNLSKPIKHNPKPRFLLPNAQTLDFNPLNISTPELSFYLGSLLFGALTGKHLFHPDNDFIHLIGVFLAKGKVPFMAAFGMYLTIVCAYVGFASISDSWNPLDWDTKDSATWINAMGGAMTGVLIPIDIATSVGAVEVIGTIIFGGIGAYLDTAIANKKNWLFWEWRWDRPSTWNGIIQGFSIGICVIGGLDVVRGYSKQFSEEVRAQFMMASWASGLAKAYVQSALSNDDYFFWNWDWHDPATYSAFLWGFGRVTGTGVAVPKGFHVLYTLITDRTKFLDLLFKPNQLMEMNQNPDHPIYKITIGMAVIYFVTSAKNNEIDPRKWNWGSYWTYDGILNGLFFGNGAPIIMKFSREAEPETLISYKAANEFFSGKPKMKEKNERIDQMEVPMTENSSFPQITFNDRHQLFHGTNNASNYLQNSLQLLNLMMKKRTKEKYRNVTSIDYLKVSETNLKTGIERWNKTKDDDSRKHFYYNRWDNN